MASRSGLGPLLVAASVAACGGKGVVLSGFSGDAGDGDSGQTFTNPDGGTTLLGDGAPGGDGGPVGPGCPQETQYVYTLAEDNTLYKFDPPTLTFTAIGVLNCQDSSGPYSMGVDRVGNAWVLYQDGRIFKVSVTTAACATTAYVTGQQGFMTFGMGFSSNSPGSPDDTLFVSDSGNGGQTKGLAHIDLTSLTLNTVGQYSALRARAELTGTGDARLFGAFEGTPYVVAEIEKTSAKILSQAPQTAVNYAPGSSNFAFAFWGGDFWLFVGPGTSTDVFQYQPSKQSTAKVKTESFVIVGAGVSTCAPTVPPR